MNWISDRLPDALKAQPIWVELMECVEELFASHISRIEKIEKSRSIFTADDDDLNLKIEESGEVFNVQWNEQANKPLSILWRKDDLKFKTSAVPIEAMLKRSFIGLESYWDEYYCEKTASYLPENFKTKEQIELYGENIEDHFLTSRGFLKIDVSSMLEKDISQAEIVGIIRDELDKIIPTHIVYEGIKFILSVVIRDMAINTSALVKAKPVFDNARLGIDTAPQFIPLPDVGSVAPMDVYARHEMLNCDEVSADFWPADLPLILNDSLIIVDEPIYRPELISQLGDGQVVPEVEITLGDGQRTTQENTVLGDGSDE